MSLLDILHKPKIDVRAELNRRKGQTARLLEQFKKQGHSILAYYESPGMYRYIYKGKRDDR